MNDILTSPGVLIILWVLIGAIAIFPILMLRFMKETEFDVWVKYKLTGNLDLPERKDALSNRGWIT